MTRSFDNLFSISDTSCHWWRNWEINAWCVTVGVYPFDSRFRTVVDDFGTLVPIRRFA